jgi:hypothetical protein
MSDIPTKDLSNVSEWAKGMDMKLTLRFFLLLLLAAGMACEEKQNPQQELLEAEILGMDYSRWICGGGWKIRVDKGVILVHDLPNEEVMAKLTGDAFTGFTPLPVYIRLEQNPATACPQQYETIHELSFLSLRE